MNYPIYNDPMFQSPQTLNIGTYQQTSPDYILDNSPYYTEIDVSENIIQQTKNNIQTFIANLKGEEIPNNYYNRSLENPHFRFSKSNSINKKQIIRHHNNMNYNNNIINNSINNNFSNAYMSKNYYNNNSLTNTNSLLHSSKNKIKNLNITINNIDNNNINNNNIFTNNIFSINTHPNSNINKNIHKKINIHKTCINTPMESNRKTEQIMHLNKEIELKENEINNLKTIINEKDLYIKNLENKISSLNVNKNVDEEYEKYSKIIMLKNVKNLTTENEELHKQIKEYKLKEIKMQKLIENMSKKGIDINNILEILDREEEKNAMNINMNQNSNDINNSNSILDNNERIIKYDEIVLKTYTTNNTNNTNNNNNTFVPLNLNEEQKNISCKSCINLNKNLPVLPLKNISQFFNDNYYVKNNKNNNDNDYDNIQITNNYDCNIIRNNGNNND